MTGTERLLRYCENVESGKELTCELVRLAIRRFRKDMERSKTDWQYYYDSTAADRFVAFCELLELYQDDFAGKKLILEDWQCFLMCQLLGWKHKETGERRFNTVFCFVGRKNGKSTLSSTLLIYDILTTNGGQALCCATKKEQAQIVYASAKEMIQRNQILSSRLKVFKSTSRIINEKNSARIEAMSADSDKFDGLSPSVIIADELSAMRNYNIIKILKSGQGARKSPILFQITSGSDLLTSPGKSEYDKSKSILENVIEDDNYLALLYALDEKDDWKDPKVWKKANPCLGITLKPDFLEKMCRDAQQVPQLESEFRSKCCCQWLSNQSSWISAKVWEQAEQNAKKYKLDFSKPYFAVGSIDLSKRNDLTVFSAIAYQEGKFFIEHAMFIPEDSLGKRVQHENDLFRKWVEHKKIYVTPGAVVDYRYMHNKIREMSEEYHFSEILFDPYNSSSLINDLGEDFELVEIAQSIKMLSPFAKAFEEEVLKGNVVDGNPVAKWAVSNTTIFTDANGNIKPIKLDDHKKSRHIDSVITSLMGVGRIKGLLDANELDLRSNEDIARDAQDMLVGLKWG